MITNMEWGAVAYLSHSKYGTCTNGTCSEVKINSSSSYITGGGSNAYNTTSGMLTSTTQNIYGVYDMSGGTWEYTMANMIYKDGVTPMSGSSSNQNSGYTGRVYYDNSANQNVTWQEYTGKEYPKTYIDKYSYSSNSRKITKLGDSVKEVYGDSSTSGAWYADYNSSVAPTVPWFGRGGPSVNGSAAGVFASYIDNGDAYSYYSARLAFVSQVTK